jgi:hypothetical protein
MLTSWVEELLEKIPGGNWEKHIASSGMLRRVAPVRTDVSEELSASIIRVTRLGELGTTLTLTMNRRRLLALFLVHRFLSPLWRWHSVPPKHRFLQELHGVTSQKAQFFIVIAMKTSNLAHSTSFRVNVIPVKIRTDILPNNILEY